MVGLMTMTWAWAETTLALTIGVIDEHAGPIKGCSEAPLSLKNRISCLKIALRDIAVLHPVQKEGRALATRFKELSVRRHDFVHGAASQHREGGFQAVGIGVKAGDYAVKNHRFDIGDAIRLNGEIAKLQDDTLAFMQRVCAVFDVAT